MDAPSMVQRSGDTLIVRSVVSGNQLYLDQEADQLDDCDPAAAALRSTAQQLARHQAAAAAQLGHQYQPPHRLQSQLQQPEQPSIHRRNTTSSHGSSHPPTTPTLNVDVHPSPASAFDPPALHALHTAASATDDSHLDLDYASGSGSGSAANLPQCKIKRNYSCNSCTYFTQNPRHFLTHLKAVHGEKIVINACRHCLYASRHYQKLVRHMKMVHGSTDGLEEQALSRKRASQLAREQKKRKCSVGAMLGSLEAAELQQQQVQQQQQQQVQQQVQQHHHLQLQIQRQYQQQMQQHHQQLMQQQQHQHQHQQQLQHRHSLGARPRRSSSPEPPPADAAGAASDAELHMDCGSMGSCPSSPEPPEPIVTLHDTGSGDEDAASASDMLEPHQLLAGGGLAAMCGDQSDNSKQLKCTLCEFSTYWRVQLVEHERVEHKLTQFYRCAKCSYVTHIKARYSKHVKYHSMPMIKCEMCDFRTPYKWNLDRHMKNHGGAGLYKCSACNFTADIKQSLTVHEMNHHVPPVGHASGMSMARRRNKVGGTDIVDGIMGGGQDYAGGGRRGSFDGEMMMMLGGNNNNNNGEGFAEPPPHLLKAIKLEAPADLSMPRQSPTMDGRKPSRPVPNLIPIQGQSTSPPPPPPQQAMSNAQQQQSVMNLSMVGGRNLLASLASLAGSGSGAGAVATGTDLSAVTNATIQDLAQLLLAQSQTAAACAAAAAAAAVAAPTAAPEPSRAAQLSPGASSSASSSSVSLVAGGVRRKPTAGGNFFEEMTKKLAANAGSVSTLLCPCGHAAKCLSERIIHQKQCTRRQPSPTPPPPQTAASAAPGGSGPVNLSLSGGSGSTRCQHCRHRCKSSTDLYVHMQNCPESQQRHISSNNNNNVPNRPDSLESSHYADASEDGRGYRDEEDDGDDDDDDDGDQMVIDDDSGEDADETDDESGTSGGGGRGQRHISRRTAAGESATSSPHKHPMENRVFVWNNMSSGNSSADPSERPGQQNANNQVQQHGGAGFARGRSSSAARHDAEHDTQTIRFYGVETAPGYGEVTQKLPLGTAGSSVGGGLTSATSAGSLADEDAASASLKKVFKCPHCSFWASTASRFHVHIVGHLNKKPFECSLCSYRSNWRWDITKHIRLKTIRDPGHKNARVLMNDETGRRNYTKYNKHITLMKVTEEDGDPKLLKSGEMTPSQEAALSFLGQSSSDSGQLQQQSSQQQQQQHQSSSSSSMQMLHRGGGGGGGGTTTSSEDGFDSCDAPLSLVKLGGGAAEAGRSATVAAMPALIPTSPTKSSQNNNNNSSNYNNNSSNVNNNADCAGGQHQAAEGNAGDAKKTSFKCKKCNFRHSNRDVVLTHVKGHYHDAGIVLDDTLKRTTATAASASAPDSVQTPVPVAQSTPLSSPAAAGGRPHVSLPVQPDRSAAISIHLQPLPPPPPPSTASQVAPQLMAADMSMALNGNPQPPPLWSPIAVATAGAEAVGGLLLSKALSPPTAMANNNNNSAHQQQQQSGSYNSIENNGEMDEASSLGTSVAGWRDPAPYRCGHCHQVSNWKHVIQRHCRLKHNGDINIEFIEKGSRSAAYTRLFIPGVSSATDAPPAITTATNNNPASAAAPEIITAAASEPSTAPPPSPSTSALHQQLVTPANQPNQLIQLLNQKPKHHLCPHCFYSSPCRSQLEAHQRAVHPQQPSDNNGLPIDDADDADDSADLDAIIRSSRVPNVSGAAPQTLAQRQLANIWALRDRNEFATFSTQPNNSRIVPRIAAHPSGIGELLVATAAAAAASASAQSEVSDTTSATVSGRPEQCPHCPFETRHAERLARHMQHHRCVGGEVATANASAAQCAHCDFAVADARELRRHVRLHFGGGGGEEAPLPVDDEQAAEEEELADEAMDVEGGGGAARSARRERRQRRSERRDRRGERSQRRQSVRYFTRYENLVLTSSGAAAASSASAAPPKRAKLRTSARCGSRRLEAEDEEAEPEEQEVESEATGVDEQIVIYPVPIAAAVGVGGCGGRQSVESAASGGSSDKENKIIVVDIVTGEVLGA